MYRLCALFLLWSFTVAAGNDGDLSLQIVDAVGMPVDDAVVTVRPASGVPAGAMKLRWGTVMVQQNIAFNPHVLIVPVGATVQFPNKDQVRHHIYSFSKPARFEMKLYSHDETRSYTFTTAGTVALGCNIHDRMSGFIKVVDTPYVGKSGPNGTAQISAIPSGMATVTIWREGLRAPGNEVTMQLPIPASGTVSRRITVQLR